MPIRVAMTLWIPFRGVRFGDAAEGVAGDALDAVVQRISGFAAVDALGEVPVEAIVNRVSRHWRGRGVIEPAQERQFFFEQRRHDALEGEQAGGARTEINVVQIARTPRHRRVLRVTGGFIAQHAVKLVQFAGRIEQRSVHVVVGIASVDAQFARPVEQRLVNFDQAVIVDVVHVQRHGANKTFARLRQNARGQVEMIVRERIDALFERIDAVERAGQPALHQRRRCPTAPILVRRGGRNAAPAH